MGWASEGNILGRPCARDIETVAAESFGACWVRVVMVVVDLLWFEKFLVVPSERKVQY